MIFNRSISDKTRVIAICNPNNPTGHILSVDEREAIVRAADKVGAWILADEVYAGAEHNVEEITSLDVGRLRACICNWQPVERLRAARIEDRMGGLTWKLGR